MNVKTAKHVLNLSPMWITTKARRLGIKKVKGQYDFTDTDLERIKNAPRLPFKRSNKREILKKETGLTGPQISAMIYRLNLSIKKDFDAILYISKEWQTGFYTYKGLRKLLKDFKARI